MKSIHVIKESEFAATAGNDSSLLFALGAMSGEKVGKHAVTSMLKKRWVASCGFQNWIGSQLVAFLPRSFVVRVAARLNRPPPFRRTK